MAPFMVFSWEVKSSWAGVPSTKPGRVFVYWVDFTSLGGKWRNGGGGMVRSGFKVTLDFRNVSKLNNLVAKNYCGQL